MPSEKTKLMEKYSKLKKEMEKKTISCKDNLKEATYLKPDVDIAFGTLDFYLCDNRKRERRTFFNY